MRMSSGDRLRAIVDSWRSTHIRTGKPVKGTMIDPRVTVHPEGHGYIERLTTDGPDYIDYPVDGHEWLLRNMDGDGVHVDSRRRGDRAHRPVRTRRCTGFATDCAVLRPFGLSLEIRGGYIGAFSQQQDKLGAGRTMMGAGSSGPVGTCLARYDSSWRRVIMVVTDGQSCDGIEAERNIRSLVRHDDFDVFGIGIQTQGRLARMFPHWCAIADAWELSPALMRMMRKAVVRG